MGWVWGTLGGDREVWKDQIPLRVGVRSQMPWSSRIGTTSEVLIPFRSGQRSYIYPALVFDTALS